jgi:hypothetical protein
MLLHVPLSPSSNIKGFSTFITHPSGVSLEQFFIIGLHATQFLFLPGSRWHIQSRDAGVSEFD